MESDWYIGDVPQDPIRTSVTGKHLGHMAIIAMLLFVMAGLFVPVWQSAVNRSLIVQLDAIGRDMEKLDENRRVLQAQIASINMPEALVDAAWQNDMAFTRIEADHLTMVSREV